MSNDSTRKAAALRKVAEALRAWGEFKGADSPEAREAARTALELAVRHLGIMMMASTTYGCHGPADFALHWFRQAASERRLLDFEKCCPFWRELTQPRETGGPRKLGLPDELERWADELDKTGAVPALPREGADVSESDGKAATPTIVSDDAKMSVAELSKAFGVPAEPLRKRLERLRKRDLTCFTEVSDRAQQEPQFLYHVGKVRPVIEAMKPSDETSGERPTKKIFPPKPHS